MILNVVKIFVPWLVSFFAGLAFSPLLTHFLYKYKMWKKKSGKGTSIGGGGTPIFDKLHKERDTNTPRMGGVVIWVSVLFTIFIFWVISQVIIITIFEKRSGSKLRRHDAASCIIFDGFKRILPYCFVRFRHISFIITP